MLISILWTVSRSIQNRCASCCSMLSDDEVKYIIQETKKSQYTCSTTTSSISSIPSFQTIQNTNHLEMSYGTADPFAFPTSETVSTMKFESDSAIKVWALGGLFNLGHPLNWYFNFDFSCSDFRLQCIWHGCGNTQCRYNSMWTLSLLDC